MHVKGSSSLKIVQCLAISSAVSNVRCVLAKLYIFIEIEVLMRNQMIKYDGELSELVS